MEMNKYDTYGSATKGLLLAPITALQFIDNLLLAGEGPFLKIYDTSNTTQTLQTNTQIFQAVNIHGITIGPNLDRTTILVAIHGAKNCCVLKLDTQSLSVTIECVDEFLDWLFVVTWLDMQDDHHIALTTAHNSILRWDWRRKTILETVHCQEKCILYSALLIGDCWRHLVCCGGTVFNQVVIWGVSGDLDTCRRRNVWHRLAGHQGVIFSMCFNATSRLLCSVSDDRSIRVWRVQLSKPALTGKSEWELAQFTLVHVLFGHTARVWDACYLGNYLISVGEDSACCVWDADGEVVRRFKGHRGKSIWSLAVNEASQLIATGGGDTSIRLWEIGDGERSNNANAVTVLRPPPHLFEDASFLPKAVILIDKKTVLIMTDMGVLFRCDIAGGSWAIVSQDANDRSYSVLGVSLSGEITAVGNIHGYVKLFTKGGCSKTQCYEGKVFSLIWLSENKLLTTGPEGKMILWNVVYDLPGHASLCLDVILTLPPARQRWATAGSLLSESNFLVIGDRLGSVHVYDLNKLEAIIDPFQSFWKIHGKAGVTDVCYHRGDVYSAGRDGEYRQFDVTEWRLVLLHSNKVLKGLEWIARLHFTTDDLHVLGFLNEQFVVHSVNTNQTLLALSCGGGHRAWDFSLNDVSGDVTFVYVKARQVELRRTQLRHRHTVLKPSLHGREVTDVKLISTSHLSEGSMSILATSSEDTHINLIGLHHCHGSGPKCAIVATLQGHISSVRTLATSASRLDKSCETLKRNQSILFSAGGRAQLKAWRISTSFGEDNLSEAVCKDTDDANICEHGCWMNAQYEHLATYNLHEKERRNLKPWRKATFNPSPETRYMSLAAVPLSQVFKSAPNHLHLVSAACSDGFLRVLCFDEIHKRFHVLANSSFHDHCVLKTHLFTTKHATYVCSAGTDGNVAFWDLTATLKCYLECFQEECAHLLGDVTEPCLTDLTSELLAPDLVVRAHQSGINALDVFMVNDVELLLATGGDDNCLTVHRVALADTEMAERHSLTVVASGKNTTAHATQITGVSIAGNRELKSVSIDHRLISWTVSETLQVKQSSCQYVHVDDISQLHTWQMGIEKHTIVTGVGLEYLRS